jgi:hypothetical protein
MPPIDKQAHFWWGWAIAATCFPLGVWTALFLATAMGAAKEVWDKQGHGTPDTKDFAATVLGGLGGVLTTLLFTSL